MTLPRRRWAINDRGDDAFLVAFAAALHRILMLREQGVRIEIVVCIETKEIGESEEVKQREKERVLRVSNFLQPLPSSFFFLVFLVLFFWMTFSLSLTFFKFIHKIKGPDGWLNKKKESKNVGGKSFLFAVLLFWWALSLSLSEILKWIFSLSLWWRFFLFLSLSTPISLVSLSLSPPMVHDKRKRIYSWGKRLSALSL